MMNSRIIFFLISKRYRYIISTYMFQNQASTFLKKKSLIKKLWQPGSPNYLDNPTQLLSDLTNNEF